MASNDETQYFKDLVNQGQDNLNICPQCFAANERKKFCINAVYLKQDKVMCCCYLGDKNEITEEAFAQKVRALKANHQLRTAKFSV